MRVGRYQLLGLLGIALWAIGALPMVATQWSPTYFVPDAVTNGFFAVGAVLFWIGVLGGVYEAFRGPSRRPAIVSPDAVPPK